MVLSLVGLPMPDHSRSLPLLLLAISAFHVAGCSRTYVSVISPPLECITYFDDAPKAATCSPLPYASWDRRNPALSYPPTLQQAGITGAVSLGLWISPSGIVDSISVATGSTSVFINSVLSEVRTWRFRYEGPPHGAAAGGSPPRRAVVPLEVWFRLRGCGTARPTHQRVIALETSLLVEVAGCQAPAELRRIGLH